MTVKELFYKKSQDLDKPILLFFYRGKQQKSGLDQLEKVFEKENNLHLFSIDVELHPELAKSFGVQFTPKLLIILNGKETGRYRAEEISEELLRKMILEMKNQGFIS
jgi:thioredoxin-like negative regulator of GroEL